MSTREKPIKAWAGIAHLGREVTERSGWLTVVAATSTEMKEAFQKRGAEGPPLSRGTDTGSALLL